MRINKSKISGWRWQHVDAPLALLELLSKYDFLTCPPSEHIEIFNHNPKKGVVWAKITWADSCYFVKARTSLSWSRRLTMSKKKSASRIEWNLMDWVQRRNLHTTTRVALGELRKFRLLYCDVLLLKWEERALTLEDYHRGLRDEASSNQELGESRQQLLAGVGGLIAEMHLKHCYHRQFHFGNVMVRAASTLPTQFLIIDLKHLSVFDKLPPEEWIWSFYILPYWLREPVVDWSESSQDLSHIIAGYYKVNSAGFSSSGQLFTYLRPIMPNRSPVKLHKRPKRINPQWLEAELGIRTTDIKPV